MGKDFLRRWREGSCPLPPACLSSSSHSSLQTSSLQKRQTFPQLFLLKKQAVMLWSNWGIRHYFPFQLLIQLGAEMWEAEWYHPHPLSHLGLFTYACARTLLRRHAGMRTHPSPLLHKILFAQERQTKSSKPLFIQNTVLQQLHVPFVMGDGVATSGMNQPIYRELAWSNSCAARPSAEDEQSARILLLFLWEERAKYIIARPSYLSQGWIVPSLKLCW